MGQALSLSEILTVRLNGFFVNQVWIPPVTHPSEYWALSLSQQSFPNEPLSHLCEEAAPAADCYFVALRVPKTPGLNV